MKHGESFKVAADVVARIQAELWETYGNASLIFRGTANVHQEPDGINSSIYRDKTKKHLFEEFEEFRPIHVEHEIVANAKRFFRPGAGNVEVLTDLRHFGGHTTLIDFSRDMMVALFFACKGDLESRGQLIVCRERDFERLSDSEYNSELKGLRIVEPALTDASKARIIAQSSIFVHAPDGFIEREFSKCFEIAAQEKRPLMAQ